MECKILVGADGAYSKASTPSRQDRIGGVNTLDSVLDRMRSHGGGVHNSCFKLCCEKPSKRSKGPPPRAAS